MVIKMKKKFSIGKNFSTDPTGRYYTDGDGSGEEFREEHLKEILLKLECNDTLTIELDDGVEAYGSSFLVEGFARLVTYGYFKHEYLISKISFTYSDDDFSFYEDKIKQYISEAAYNSKKYQSTKKEAIKSKVYKGKISTSYLKDF